MSFVGKKVVEKPINYFVTNNNNMYVVVLICQHTKQTMIIYKLILLHASANSSVPYL